MPSALRWRLTCCQFMSGSSSDRKIGSLPGILGLSVGGVAVAV